MSIETVKNVNKFLYINYRGCDRPTCTGVRQPMAATVRLRLAYTSLSFHPKVRLQGNFGPIGSVSRVMGYIFEIFLRKNIFFTKKIMSPEFFFVSCISEW